MGIIVAGGLVLSQFGGSQRFLEDRILAPPIVLIVAGSVVFLIAFLGCCGAIKENYLMLIAVSLERVSTPEWRHCARRCLLRVCARHRLSFTALPSVP